MRGHDVYFDIPENNRIGFSVSDCDYNSLIGMDIFAESKASGQEQRGGSDDYYEEELSKLETPEGGQIGGGRSSPFPGDLFQSVGLAQVGLVVGVLARGDELPPFALP